MLFSEEYDSVLIHTLSILSVLRCILSQTHTFNSFPRVLLSRRQPERLVELVTLVVDVTKRVIKH